MGMGCWAIGGPFIHPRHGFLAYGQVDDKDSAESVKLGIELGVTLFDTANVYGCGRSERVLGEALKDYRSDVVIATKFGSTFEISESDSKTPCRAIGRDVSAEGIIEACDVSLERLQTDYIDLYQLHSGDLEVEMVPDVIETLEHLVDEGKIRFYGWSTDDPERAALFADGQHCATVQFGHNMLSHNDDMIENVIDGRGLSGLIKGPLGYGLHTGKYKDDSVLPKEHMWHGTKFNEGKVRKVRNALERVREIVTNDGRTLAQAALGWIWAEHERLIPIPGFKNSDQVRENATAMEYGPLSSKQASEVRGIAAELVESN
ncbi:MAG: aldo/keto reductase [Candidatus Thorarchaeota archaeon]|nr:MAG: aldo/keto reductase [Candidatus Thorarchaeota archaeon]